LRKQLDSQDNEHNGKLGTEVTEEVDSEVYKKQMDKLNLGKKRTAAAGGNAAETGQSHDVLEEDQDERGEGEENDGQGENGEENQGDEEEIENGENHRDPPNDELDFDLEEEEEEEEGEGYNDVVDNGV